MATSDLNAKSFCSPFHLSNFKWLVIRTCLPVDCSLAQCIMNVEPPSIPLVVLFSSVFVPASWPILRDVCSHNPHDRSSVRIQYEIPTRHLKILIGVTLFPKRQALHLRSDRWGLRKLAVTLDSKGGLEYAIRDVEGGRVRKVLLPICDLETQSKDLNAGRELQSKIKFDK
jgi:hypothetical protein